MPAAIVGVLLALPPADATPAHGGKRAARLTLNVVVVGDFFSYGYAKSADPTLRLSVPPTLAALNQIQLANQGVQIRVLFIPVWESTWDDLYKSSGRPLPTRGSPLLPDRRALSMAHTPGLGSGPLPRLVPPTPRPASAQ
jgi:hypothetical protein